MLCVKIPNRGNYTPSAALPKNGDAPKNRHPLDPLLAFLQISLT